MESALQDNKLFSILDTACAEIEISMVSDRYVSDEAIDVAERIGVNDSGDLHDPESYIVAFFQRILLLRDKLEIGLLQQYLTKPIEEKWEKLLYLVEKNERTLLGVHKGSIIFTLFCPTAESFHMIKTCMRDFEELFEVCGNISIFTVRNVVAER